MNPISRLADSLKDIIAQMVREEIALVQTARTSEDVTETYLSTNEAATFAKVSAATIRRWVKEGRLEGYGAGRELRVLRDELEQLMRGPRRRNDTTGAIREVSPEALAERALRGEK